MTQVYLMVIEPDRNRELYEILSEKVEQTPGVNLINGELGSLSEGFRFVESPMIHIEREIQVPGPQKDTAWYRRFERRGKR